MNQRETCPACGKYLLVPASGPKSDVLIVGEFPGWQEEKLGIPFVGQAGDILRTEMSMVGLQLSTFRITNLWQHQKNEKSEVDLQWMVTQLVNEMKHAKYILFMGSECAKTLFQLSVLETAGMKVKSPLLPPNVKVAMIAPNPAIVLHDTVGELRLSLKRFAEAVQ